jgi:hypothetical protein
LSNHLADGVALLGAAIDRTVLNGLEPNSTDRDPPAMAGRPALPAKILPDGPRNRRVGSKQEERKKRS